MKNVRIDGRWYVGFDYYDYIANNLSQFGCAIFDSEENPNIDFESLKKELQTRFGATQKMFAYPLVVYRSKDKTLQTYWTFVNESEMSPAIFFDLVKMACISQHLNKFYACDFKADKIYGMTPWTMCEFGKLKDFKKLLRLDGENYIVGKWLKWCGPIGYSRYYSHAKVFRNDIEKEYYAQYGKRLTQYCDEKLDFDTFYSLDECGGDDYNLKFDKMTTLNFDVDKPYLSIDATSLRARNLDVKTIKAEEIFCDKLRCESVVAERIYAESIECQKLKAKTVKTNFEGGIKFV